MSFPLSTKKLATIPLVQEMQGWQHDLNMQMGELSTRLSRMEGLSSPPHQDEWEEGVPLSTPPLSYRRQPVTSKKQGQGKEPLVLAQALPARPGAWTSREEREVREQKSPWKKNGHNTHGIELIHASGGICPTLIPHRSTTVENAPRDPQWIRTGGSILSV